LEQLGQTLGVLGEDVLGDLAAARELGPVPGVGRRGDDLRVDRGGGHAREQDRRGAGEAGERGLHVDAAVGQGDQLRLVRGPRALDRRGRSRGEEVAQSATGAAPTVERPWTATVGAAPGVKRLRSPPRVAAATTPTPWPRRTDRLRRVRASPGPMSRSHSAPECRAWAISSTQSTGSTRTRRASEAARSASSPQRAAQSRTMSTAGAIAGWWKPTSTSSGSKTGAKTSPPVSLASRRRR